MRKEEEKNPFDARKMFKRSDVRNEETIFISCNARES